MTKKEDKPKRLEIEEPEPSDFTGAWCPGCHNPITEHRMEHKIQKGMTITCPYCKTTFKVG